VYPCMCKCICVYLCVYLYVYLHVPVGVLMYITVGIPVCECTCMHLKKGRADWKFDLVYGLEGQQQGTWEEVTSNYTILLYNL
jgi:hypothetical protein